jgi:hypothetical protein
MAWRRGLSVALSVGLAGCSGGAPRPAAAPAASLATRTDDAVHVSFYARSQERWTLRSAEGGVLCKLPCAGWVGSEAGLVLVEDELLVDGQPVTFPVPSQLPAVAGDELVVTVDRTHAWGTGGKVLAAPIAVIFGLGGLALTALSTASLATGSKQTKLTTSGCAKASTSTAGTGSGVSACETTESTGVAADVGGLAIGIGSLAVAAAATYWFFHARPGGLAFEERAPNAALAARLGPDGVEVRAGPARVVVTPAGIAGTF